MNIKSVAVFCGSQNGKNPVFAQHAKELGRFIALLKLKLIYGGGNKGLMGILADSVMANGGEAMGIIPEILTELEHQHKKLTELAIVPDMHTRKKMMFDRCDAAIILPGGFGTMDEFFEMLTWNQLKLHDKKIYLLNSADFYTHLIKHLHILQKEQFLYDYLDDQIVVCETPVEIFNKIN
jgi:uncharacterized protein (TIGR00730 family)